MSKLLYFLNCNSFFFFFLFFLGSLFMITASLIIFTESSVHAILYLMFLFVYLTELTILLKMEFLALIFIIIYIGAVCVLMLFHIKLIKTFIHRSSLIDVNGLFIPFTNVVICLPLLQIISLLCEKPLNESNKQLGSEVFLNQAKIFEQYNYTSWVDLYEPFKSTQLLGYLLYNVYFIYLIFGSFILFVAMIGSIFLTLIKKKDKKFQKIDNQVFVNISKSLILK